MQEMERQCQQGLLCIRPSPAHYCATADSLRKQRGEKQGVRAATTALAASFSPPPFPRHQQLAWHGHSCPRRPQPPGRTRRRPAAEATAPTASPSCPRRTCRPSLVGRRSLSSTGVRGSVVCHRTYPVRTPGRRLTDAGQQETRRPRRRQRSRQGISLAAPHHISAVRRRAASGRLGRRAGGGTDGPPPWLQAPRPAAGAPAPEAAGGAGSGGADLCRPAARRGTGVQ